MFIAYWCSAPRSLLLKPCCRGSLCMSWLYNPRAPDSSFLWFSQKKQSCFTGAAPHWLLNSQLILLPSFLFPICLTRPYFSKQFPKYAPGSCKGAAQRARLWTSTPSRWVWGPFVSHLLFISILVLTPRYNGCKHVTQLLQNLQILSKKEIDPNRGPNNRRTTGTI